MLAAVVVATLAVVARAGDAAPRVVRLEVTDAGQYVLAGRPVALADLRARLRELKSGGGPIDLHVTGGPNVAYEAIEPAMRIVQEEGLAKAGLLTVPPDVPASSSR